MSPHNETWTLPRVAVGLQVMLALLVVAVLTVATLILVNQNRSFAAEAEQRAAESELAALRTQAAIETLTCILLIAPDERTPENVKECRILSLP